MKHGSPRNICPWCKKQFDTREGVESHQQRVHRHNQPLTPQATAEQKMAEYDRTRRKGQSRHD